MEVETCSLFLDDGQEGLLGGDLRQTGDVMFSVVWGGDSLGGESLGGDKLLLYDVFLKICCSLHISIFLLCCLCFSTNERGLLTIVGVTAHTFLPNDREFGREIFSSNGGARSGLLASLAG